MMTDQTPDQTSQTSPLCGGPALSGPCVRAPHGPEYPHYADRKYAGKADADMPGAPLPPVDLWSAEWPYSTLGAADFAALYRTAAEIITARGYYAYELQDDRGEPGISVCGALKAAAFERAQAADPEGNPRDHYHDAMDVTEELETRLSCVLYLIGQLHDRTGIRDLSDQLAAWELGHYSTAQGGTRATAVALLGQAAALFTLMADTAAPVTAAPAPAYPENGQPNQAPGIIP